MTLGEIIKKLKQAPADARVVYDFANFGPSMNLDSYRGDYSETFLGYQEYCRPLVSELLGYLEERIGQTMIGYKGGEYTIREDKNVFVADSSQDYTQCIIHKVKIEDYLVILCTKYQKD